MLRRGEKRGAMPPGVDVLTDDGAAVVVAVEAGGAAVVVKVPL